MLHRLIRYSCTNAPHISPTLNRSSALQHFERSNVVEIRNGMMFDFYTGLPHMQKRSSKLLYMCSVRILLLYDNQYLNGNILLKCCISSSAVNIPDLDWKKTCTYPLLNTYIYIYTGRSWREHLAQTWRRGEREGPGYWGMRRRVERRCLSTPSLPTVGQKLVFRLLMTWAWYVNKKQTILQDVPLMISLL